MQFFDMIYSSSWQCFFLKTPSMLNHLLRRLRTIVGLLFAVFVLPSWLKKQQCHATGFPRRIRTPGTD